MKGTWKQSKIVVGFQKLCADLKPMTFAQKCEHMWMYYKEWLLVIFMVVMSICLAVTVLKEQDKEVLVSGMMINISIEQKGMEYLTTDYAQHLGATEENQVAEVDYTAFGDPFDPETGEISMTASMILPARVSGAMLDYILLDQYAMEYYIAYDVYMDLRDFFTEAELEALNEQKLVVYAQQEGDYDRVPVAVKITQIDFVKDNIGTDKEIYFALSGSSPRPEMCRHAWNYIHAWKSEK